MALTFGRYIAPGLLLALGATGGASAEPPAAKSDAKPAVADADLKAWVDRRVEERQPSGAERRFDEVGWVHTVVEAQRLAKEHNRPVFLFTHDGRMNLGRC
jgi:hypothetical protein